MHADTRKLEFVSEFPKPGGDPLRPDPLAVSAGEHEVVFPSDAEAHELGTLRDPIRPQVLDGVAVERDGARPRRGLRRSFHDAAAGHGTLIRDRRDPQLKIEIVPPQAEHLATPGAGDDQEPPQRRQRFRFGTLEEPVHLFRIPRAEPADRGGAAQLRWQRCARQAASGARLRAPSTGPRGCCDASSRSVRLERARRASVRSSRRRAPAIGSHRDEERDAGRRSAVAVRKRRRSCHPRRPARSTHAPKLTHATTPQPERRSAATNSSARSATSTTRSPPCQRIVPTPQPPIECVNSPTHSDNVPTHARCPPIGTIQNSIAVSVSSCKRVRVSSLPHAPRGRRPRWRDRKRQVDGMRPTR